MIGIDVNDIEVEDLFSYYDRYNFLYPEKKEKLRKVLPIIKANWISALKLPLRYFLLLTHYNDEDDSFASVSAWRSSQRSYCLQHMVSNNPENTRLILLHLLAILQKEIVDNNAVQVYFQSKTRFAANMFSFLSKTAGRLHSYDHRYSFINYPVHQREDTGPPLFLEPLNHKNKNEIIEFIRTERSEFYSWVQDINEEDLHLDALNAQYGKYGLSRSRKIFAYRNDSNQLLGVTINNQASIGLNFSLLENACEIILNSAFPIWILNEVINKVLYHTCQEYSLSGLESIPVLIDPTYEDLVIQYGGRLMRKYDYFTCDNTVIDEWKTYLTDELVEVQEHLMQKSKT